MLNGVLYIFTIDSRKLGRKKWKNAFDLSRTLDHRSKLKKKLLIARKMTRLNVIRTNSYLFYISYNMKMNVRKSNRKWKINTGKILKRKSIHDVYTIVHDVSIGS